MSREQILIVDVDGSHIRLDDLFEIEKAYQEEEFARVVELTDRFLASYARQVDNVPEALIAPVYFMRAFAHNALQGDLDRTIVAYEEAIERFRAVDEPTIQAWVSSALFNRGGLLKKIGDLDAALASYAEVISRFSTSAIPEVQEAVAGAMVNTATSLPPQQAISIFDDMIERFGSGDTPRLQIAVGKAMCNKGSMLARLGELEAAIQSYEEVVDQFSNTNVPELQVTVGDALLQKGHAQEIQRNLALQ